MTSHPTQDTCHMHMFPMHCNAGPPYSVKSVLGHIGSHCVSNHHLFPTTVTTPMPAVQEILHQGRATFNLSYTFILSSHIVLHCINPYGPTSIFWQSHTIIP